MKKYPVLETVLAGRIKDRAKSLYFLTTGKEITLIELSVFLNWHDPGQFERDPEAWKEFQKAGEASDLSEKAKKRVISSKKFQLKPFAS